MTELVSVVLPVHNGETYLEEAMNSVLRQTYSNLELIVVNDCSTDSSVEIMRNLASQDERVKIVNNPRNMKLPATLNAGHRLAKGKWITWTSDDNILETDFIGTMVKQIDHSGADVVYSDYKVISKSGAIKRINRSGPVAGLPFGNTIGAAFLYTREVFEGLQGYGEDLHTVEDYDFWLRASIRYRFYHSPTDHYRYRTHGSSLTANLETVSARQKSFTDLLLLVRSEFAHSLNWAPTSVSFLDWNHEAFDFSSFKHHFKRFVYDLDKYQTRIETNDMGDVQKELNKRLRRYLGVRKVVNGRSVLSWILINRPNVFFDRGFSSKSTIRLVTKLLRS